MNSVQNQTEMTDNQSVIFSGKKKKPYVQAELVSSHLQRLQLYGNKLKGQSYQVQKLFQFNSKQQQMYSVLVYGISDEIKTTLPASELNELQKKHQRAQKIINQWKNDIVNGYVQNIFGKVFWNSDIAKEMVVKTNQDRKRNILNNMSFKDLGLEKRHVAQKLIAHKLLPEDFFQLTA